MLYIITPCSRPENLDVIQNTIPTEAKWIICHDNNIKKISSKLNAIIMRCDETGLVGTKARNYVLDNYDFKDEDIILFHDDDNIVHSQWYNVVSQFFDYDFSIICWGQLNKDNSIRLYPTNNPKIDMIDTASYLIKWKYNKHIRHNTTIYQHDGQYAEDCAKNGPIITINAFICYYNYLR